MEITCRNMWSVLDRDLEKIPAYIKNALYINGFSNVLAFIDVVDIDKVINAVENFVQNDLLNVLQSKLKWIGSTFDENDELYFFGAFKPRDFYFGEGDKRLIHKIIEHIQQTIGKFGIKGGINYFCEPKDIELVAIKDWYFVDSEFCNFDNLNGIECNAPNIGSPSHTHAILNKLLVNADNNLNKPKGGYRFSKDVIEFAKYLRMLSGRMAYETLQKNLQLALPSINTIDRRIHRSNHSIVEGVLRSEELRLYLIERGCEMVVSLSEDATRIENRVQYDRSTNQLVGFVQPTDSLSGFPIPFTFKARTATEILRHFTNGTETAKFINTVMAKPDRNTPAFCLLIYGTNGTNSARDVSNRWLTITKILQEKGIKVLTFSSDGDPRYSSAMKANSKLGHDSNLLSDCNWFRSCNETSPFYIQDLVHVGCKMRNHFLKTIRNPKKLPFGIIDTTELFIEVDHLKELLGSFSKGQHWLTETTINPVDRQNFDSVLRICHPRVISLLKKHVQHSQATVEYLNIMRDSILAFTEINLNPLERIEKVWYSLFMVRFWKEYILSHNLYTIKENFLTANCYNCLEINAHSLVLIILHLNEIEKPSWFTPEIFNSQSCESFYRQIRSFTSTYSTVANCSVKEIINRISKIQLQSDISNSLSSEFNFPRSQKTETSTVVPRLPSKQEIIAKIEECKISAISSAMTFKLIKPNSKELGICKVQPHSLDKAKIQQLHFQKSQPLDLDFDTYSNDIFSPGGLKNFADNFGDEEEVDTNSQYVEILCCDTSKRVIVKKTSLCWLLRKNNVKLSSDRLERVKGPTRRKKRILHYQHDQIKGRKIKKLKKSKKYSKMVYKNVV